MNFGKSIVLSSLVATAVLFGGCSDDDNKTPTVVVPTGEKPVFVSPNTYNVVAGQRKAVTLTVGENIINTVGNKFKFEIVDNSEAPSTRIDENTGVITYTAPAEGSAKIIVKATRILEGNSMSDDFVITFSTMSPNGITVVKPYKTGADADAGTENIDRNFTESEGLNVKGPLDLEWADAGWDRANTDRLTYDAAYDYCKNEVEPRGEWRVPNKDELLNLINYSKYSSEGRPSIVNDLFQLSLTNTWATPEFGKNIYVSENSGMLTYADDQILAVRCVLGPQANREHLIHSDGRGYTYDENTGLEWSSASSELMTATEGATYCSSLESRHNPIHTNFRLPSINEFRSIVENGTVSDFITKGNRQLISSTPYVDENGTIPENNTWRLILREDGTVLIGAGDYASNISCVKDMD